MGKPKHDFWTYRPSLVNTGTLPTSGPSANGLIIASTSATNENTFQYIDGADEGGAIELAMEATSEVKNLCLYNGDTLQFDIDRIREAWFRFKLKQAALDSTTQFLLGLTGDRNDTVDSIAQAAIMRIVGGDDTTAVVVESDDGTNNNDDVATNQVIDDTNIHEFLINFALGKDDVRFFLDGQPLAQGTTFDMSNYSGALQVNGQIQKTADTNTDGWELHDLEVRGRTAA